jgi:hypothetical protein
MTAKDSNREDATHAGPGHQGQGGIYPFSAVWTSRGLYGKFPVVKQEDTYAWYA